MTVINRNITLYAIASLLPASITLISNSTYTRLIPTAEYGAYSLALISVNFTIIGASQWLQQSVNRFFPASFEIHTTQLLREAVSLSLFVTCIGLAILMLIGLIVMKRLLAPAYLPLVVPSSLMALSGTIVMTGLAVLQSEMRSREYGLYRGFAVVGGFAFALCALAEAKHASSIIWGLAFGYLVIVPLLWNALRLPTQIPILSAAVMSTIRRMISYGLPLSGWTASSMVLFFSDRFLINRFKGPAEVGIYSATYLLITGSITFIASPVLLAAHPFLMRTWDCGDRELAAQWLRKLVSLLVIAGTVVLLSIKLLEPELTAVLLGRSFREAGPIMPVVAASTLVWQISSYIQKPLEFAGRTRTMLVIIMTVVCVNTLLNLVVIPRFGYAGAAWTSLFTNCLYAILVLISGSDVLDCKLPMRSLLEICTGLCFVFAAVTLAQRLVTPLAGSSATPVLAEASAVGVSCGIGWLIWPYYRPKLWARQPFLDSYNN